MGQSDGWGDAETARNMITEAIERANAANVGFGQNG